MNSKFKIIQNNFYVGNDWIIKFITSTDKNLFGLFKHPHLEQSANVRLLDVTENFWSILGMPNIFYYFFLLILILPLVYCLLTILFFLKNQIRTIQRGKITTFEDKNPNFTNLTKDYW